MFCSKCGHMVADDAVFCSACGNTIVPDENTEIIQEVSVDVSEIKAPAGLQSEPNMQQIPQAPVAAQGSFCAGCGTFLEAGQQFCPKCGTAKGGVKRRKADSEMLKLVKTMIKTPVDGFSALYQTMDTRIPIIFVAVQTVLAVVFGILLNSKLVGSYNEYMQNLTVNLTNSLTKLLGNLGGLVPGIGSVVAGELVSEIFGSSGIDAAIVNTLQLKTDLIGIGAVLLTAVIAIVAQVVILFVLMKLFKISGDFMDSVKIYAAKSYWSALGIMISLILLLVSPWAAIGFVLIAGCFINHTIGQMLQISSPENRNQIFWIQLIFNVIEAASIALSAYYIIGIVGENFISYVGGILPILENVF